ncbi:putative quinol monooxygenase [Rhizobium johnstonii]|jgi:quinol monooxygenase YgiN|uniref:putative quinol monooxygenase n=1 Tax=Rhizobium TaxID=379 RepID=UPI00140F8452|nr:putative quinol monooxygenase [Rhizobium leguminosarum]QIO64008.1 antibiotic biosynthesis monooxygenase [Rhizobium leguminosarum bv. trifolii]
MSTVKVYAMLTAKSGMDAELEALLRGMVEPSRSEDGNLQYDLWRDASSPSRFIIDEAYVDQDANAFHRATPHFQHYVGLIGELADRVAVVVQPVDVTPKP